MPVDPKLIELETTVWRLQQELDCKTNKLAYANKMVETLYAQVNELRTQLQEPK